VTRFGISRTGFFVPEQTAELIDNAQRAIYQSS